MSDDLKKLMGKLKKEKKEKSAEVTTQDPDEDADIDATADDSPETPSEESTDKGTDEGTEEKSELQEVADQDDLAGDLAVLQNDGIFRREILLTLRELVDVHKVNTQTLLDLKELLEGADGKKKK